MHRKLKMSALLHAGIPTLDAVIERTFEEVNRNNIDKNIAQQENYSVDNWAFW